MINSLNRLLNNKYFRNGLYAITGSIGLGALNYFFHSYLARFFSVSEYGEFQTLTTILITLDLFNFSLQNFLLKFIPNFAKNKDHLSNQDFFKYIKDKISKPYLFLVFAYFVLSPLIIYFFQLSSWIGVGLILISSLLSIYFTLYSSFLISWEQFFLFNLVNLISNLVRVVVGVGIAYKIPDAHIVSISFFVLSLCSSLGYYLSFQKTFKYKWTKTLSTNNSWTKYFPNLTITSNMIQSILFSVLTTMITSIDILTVRKLTNSETTGYYSVLSTCGRIIIWITLPIISMLLPYACAEGKKGVDRKFYSLGYFVILSIGLIILTMFYLFPELVLQILFGSKYIIHKDQLFLFGLNFTILSGLLYEANLAYARSNYGILYILFFCIIISNVGLYFNHENIRSIIQVQIFVFSSGYIASILVAHFNRKITA